MRTTTARWFVLVSMTLLTTHAWADDPPDEATTVTVRFVNGRRVYDLGTRHIHGERQIPYQFAVSGRRPLEYAPDDSNVRFVDRIVRAVRHEPF